MNNTMRGLARFFGALAVGAVLVLVTPLPAGAQDVPAGTVMTRENIDDLLDKSFEGKKIGDMLPGVLERMIREQGLRMKLRPYEKVPVDPRWAAATKEFGGTATLDPATRMVKGYKAGLCFPNVSLDDPHAAEKLVWNAYYVGGYPRGMVQFYPRFAFLFISGKSGLERVQQWALIRAYLKGRLEGSPTVGDGSVDFKQLLFAHYPYDIRGIGTFTIRYGDGRLDDTWAYLRTVRRTRRLSGGTWHDPIGGTDQLNDEVEIMAAFPTWYPKYRLVGKKWILAVAHNPWPVWLQDQKDPSKAFPTVDLANPPYWNPIAEWEPRPVYVIEAIPPDEHPYSKKVMYLDAETWVYYLAEGYDKNGGLWKVLIFNMRPIKTEDGGWGVISAQGHTIDLKRKHATIFVHGRESRFNPPGIGPDDVNLGVLEAAGQGRWRVPE